MPDASPGGTRALRVSRLLHAGRPDPGWDVTRQEELDELTSRLRELPPAPKPAWPQLGPRGFLIANHGVSGFPREVRVFRGVVRVVDVGAPRYFGDVHALEGWLEAQARRRVGAR
jgi:hypothetical protein